VAVEWAIVTLRKELDDQGLDAGAHTIDVSQVAPVVHARDAGHGVTVVGRTSASPARRQGPSSEASRAEFMFV